MLGGGGMLGGGAAGAVGLGAGAGPQEVVHEALPAGEVGIRRGQPVRAPFRGRRPPPHVTTERGLPRGPLSPLPLPAQLLLAGPRVGESHGRLRRRLGGPSSPLAGEPAV